jgi:hypothetical protein
VPENDLSHSDDTPRRFFGNGAGDGASRKSVMSLDDQERRFSFIGSILAVPLAIVYAYEVAHAKAKTISVKPLSSGLCVKGFHLVGKMCHGIQPAQRSGYELAVIVLVVMGAALAIFAYRRNRPGAIVSSLLLGFLASTLGIIYMFFGAWLAVRAFRLNKYGDPTFKGSNLRARERSQERRAAKAAQPTKGSRSRSSKSGASSGSLKTPAPSKRYTPKKTNRR